MGKKGIYGYMGLISRTAFYNTYAMVLLFAVDTILVVDSKENILDLSQNKSAKG